MQDDPETDNPKTIWQNQPMEPSKMTLEEFRHRARELHSKTRRELVSNIEMALITIAISGFGSLHAHDLDVRLMFMVAVAWTVAGQYFLHRGMWSAIPPGDVLSSTGLQFYRQQIEQRLSLFSSVLRWSLGPLVLCICAVILVLTGIARNQNQTVERVMPFCTLFVIWIVIFFVLRSRGQRAMKREMVELNGIEKLHSR